MTYARKMVAMIAVTAALTVWGRGDGVSTPSASSSSETPVRGTVTTSVKPSHGGEVLFGPARNSQKDRATRHLSTAPDSAFSGKS